MQPRSDEDLLVRFRDTRDPAAFAMLFERHAFDLWRHACRSSYESDADDLVQNTFVSMIENVDAFDERRAVRPWLFGILANHMRMRSRTERQRALDPDRLDVGPARARACVPTDEIVSDAEIRDRLDGAVRGLPEPYRDVVTARFVGSERTRDIAERLGQNPGTVRKQIHRGLHMLRRALPVEIAMGALLWLFPRRARAASRVSLEGRSVWLAGAGFVAVLAMAIFVFGHSESIEAPVSSARVQGDDALVSASTDSMESTTARQIADASIATVAPVDARRRLAVTFQDGRPAANFTLRLMPAEGDSFAACQLDDRGRDVRTDAEGRLDIGSLAYRSILVPAGGLPRLYLGTSTSIEARSKTFRIGPERTVTGRVLGARGLPVANASLWISSTMGRGDAGMPIGRTEMDGSFRLRVGCEQPFVWARTERDGLSVPVRLTDAATQDVELRLDNPGRAIAGRIVGDTGEALAGALVAWFPRSDLRLSFTPVYAHCNDVGRFDLGNVCAGDGILIARHEGFATSWRRLDEELDPGELLMQLDRGHRLEGIVRDPLGSPLVNVPVQVSPAPLGQDQIDGGLRVRDTRTGEDGRYSVSGIGVGEVCVFTLDTRQGFRAKRFVEIPETRVCDLDCEATGFLAGTARDASGQPLVGWRIEGIPTEGADPALRARLITTCKTKEDGSFSLQLPRRVPYRLGLFEPGRPSTHPASQPLAVLGEAIAGSEVALVAPERCSSRIHGRVEVTDDHDATIVSVVGDRWAIPRRVPLDGEGGFSIDGVPRDHYELVLEHPRFGRRVIAEVDADGGAYDVGFVPFALPGAVVIDVPGAREASAVLRDERGTFLHRRLTSRDGRIRFTPIAPGRYVVVVASSEREPVRRELLVTSARITRLEVRAMRATPCSIAIDYDPVGMPFFPRAPLHVRVVDEFGEQVFEDFVFAGRDAVARSNCGLKAGRYRIEATGLGGRTARQEIAVASEPCEVAVSLR
ncbi:MAG: sigma-70 family RNA polymerase sigma factor [Planctomycetes bacterium]|nr:sigma-70 family RNA polymerase sigma factor [Planctomycetota bacterium]